MRFERERRNYSAGMGFWLVLDLTLYFPTALVWHLTDTVRFEFYLGIIGLECGVSHDGYMTYHRLGIGPFSIASMVPHA